MELKLETKTKAQGTEEPRRDAEMRSEETLSPNRQEMACESVGQQPVVVMIRCEKHRGVKGHSLYRNTVQSQLVEEAVGEPD